MAEAQLSAVLTAACLVMIFTVRKLGLVIAQRDSLSTSQKAMLKQVIAIHCSNVCSKALAVVRLLLLVQNRLQCLHTCE